MNPFGIVVLTATVLYPAVQLFSLPNINDTVALFSQYLGLAALILMAWAQILATRMPGIEMLFGGLDRVYVLHKWTGVLAMAAILVHDTVDADMRGLGRGGPLSDVAETFGEVSLYGLLILVVISVATFIPYHLWKWTHKAMGALFAAGAFHFFFITKPFETTDSAGVYTGAFCVAGLMAYGWTLLPERLRPSKIYTITSLQPTGGALAITMTPVKRALHPRPGQFGILQFSGAELNEPHPFSFSRIKKDGGLEVTVKPLGDFTRQLGDTLAPGQQVRIRGPFGRFERRRGAREVWIAAGIGITPFLALAQSLEPQDEPVDLFYCVRSRAEAPHLDAIHALSLMKPNLKFHLIVSMQGQRLTAAHIAEVVGADLASATVSFCGPEEMRDSLKSELRSHGVTDRRFRYEEFRFRTGIGLEKLGAWILDRMQRAVRPPAILER